MSEKIECKQVDSFLNPKWAKSIDGNARENKQEDRLDGSRVVGNEHTVKLAWHLLQNYISKTYRISVYLSHTSNASYIWEAIQNTETHKVLTHRLFFLPLSWFIFIEVSLGKGSYGRSFVLSSTPYWSWGGDGDLQVKLFKKSKLIHLFLILEMLVS